MCPVQTRCLLVPSYGTMQDMVNNHSSFFQVHMTLTSSRIVYNVKTFLSAKTESGDFMLGGIDTV